MRASQRKTVLCLCSYLDITLSFCIGHRSHDRQRTVISSDNAGRCGRGQQSMLMLIPTPTPSSEAYHVIICIYRPIFLRRINQYKLKNDLINNGLGGSSSSCFSLDIIQFLCDFCRDCKCSSCIFFASITLFRLKVSISNGSTDALNTHSPSSFVAFGFNDLLYSSGNSYANMLKA